jgi:hypothetical protein
MTTARQRDAWVAEHGSVWSEAAVEKVLLIGLLSVIYAEVLPGVTARPSQVVLAVGVFVLLNAAPALWSAGHGRGHDSIWVSFVVRLAVNLGLVGIVQLVRAMTVEDFSMDPVSALFFVFLFSVLITLYDRYRPVYDFRTAAGESGPSAGPASAATSPSAP